MSALPSVTFSAQSTVPTFPNFNRYISIVEWARQRYTSAGVLILSTGGKPSTYSRIESAAFEK